MKLVAPFVFYGWGNIGDESTLQGFARLLAKGPVRATAWVGSRAPSSRSASASSLPEESPRTCMTSASRT